VAVVGQGFSGDFVERPDPLGGSPFREDAPVADY
jgi:hypothetical protein